MTDKRINKNTTVADMLNTIIVDPSTKVTYQIGKFLGKGGFARVHELTDMHKRVTYAAKIIPKSKMTRRHQVAKVAREIMLHRDLVHENVVKLELFFEDRINVYILLENCPNQSLVHMMKKKSCFSLNETRYYVQQLVAGTKYIHSKKIIHRDLKPGNMFLSEDMVVKIGDFGLAISAENMSDQVVLCGTPNYIAPEVLCKSRQSFQIDVWAIGCTIYCLMFGIPPYESSSLEATYERIKSNNWDKTKAKCNHALLDLLERILVLDPNERLTIDEIEKHIFFDSIADDLQFERMHLNNSCSTNDSENQTNPLNNQILCSNNVNLSQQELHSDNLLISKRRTSTIKSSNPNTNSQPQKSVTNVPAARAPSWRKLMKNIFQKRKCLSDKNTSTEKQKMDCYNGADKILLANSETKQFGAGEYVDATLVKFCALGNANGFCQMLNKNSNFVLLKIVEAICDMKSFKGNDVPKLPEYNLTFVSKWIDYSNKYGFGYQLSNSSTGVLFNDNSTLVVQRNSSDIQYVDNQSKWHSYNLNDIPRALSQKHVYLEYFKDYMDEKLSDGASVRNENLHASLDPYQNPIVKRWVRTNNEIIMELTDGTFQVNFSQDHTKVILSFRNIEINSKMNPANILTPDGILEIANYLVVTYINSNREISHYKASQLLHFRPSESLLKCLSYLRCVLSDFVKIDCKV